MTMIAILAAVIAAIAGVLIGYYVNKNQTDKKLSEAGRSADQIISDAKQQAETKKKEILFDAKEESIQYKEELETNEKYKNVEELKEEINNTKIPFDHSNYFVKKAEEELEKIKNIGE